MPPRGGRGAQRPASAPATAGITDAELLKQRNKVEKTLSQIQQLNNRRAVGEALDDGQKAKLQRKSQCEEELRMLYMQGTPVQRERLGVCGNCGRAGHSTANCPRGKSVPPAATSKVAPRTTATSSQHGGRGANSRGREAGRGRGASRGAADGRGRGRGSTSTSDRGGRGGSRGHSGSDLQNQLARPPASSSGNTSATSSSAPPHAAIDAGVEQFRTVTGATQAQARRHLVAAGGDVERAINSFFSSAPPPATRGPPPAKNHAPGTLNAQGGGTSSESLLASMFAFHQTAPAQALGEDDGDEEEDNERGGRRPHPAKKKVALDKHGLPLNNRGGGRRRPQQDRGATGLATRPSIADAVLIKQRNKIQKALAEIATLAAQKAAGEALDRNQLAKLGKQAAMEEELRQVYLQGTVEQRERLGVCGNCGRSGHWQANCPRGKAVVADPRPPPPALEPAPAASENLMPHELLAAEAVVASTVRYLDPALTNFRALEASAVATCHATAGSATGGDSGSGGDGQPAAAAAATTTTGSTTAAAKSAAIAVGGRADSSGGVLIVAEKPSVAKAIAQHLSKGRLRTASPADSLAPMCKLHHFHQFWTPTKAMLPVCATSVTGHLFSLDFDESANRGAGAANPGALYGAKTRKLLEDNSERNGLAAHLIAAAEGCRWLYLWLDCDREGENICFEVLSILRGAGLFVDDASVYRAHFSALTPSALFAAFGRPRRPNADEAMAVDARQELDLKIGCSFTRFLTRQLLEGAKVTFDDPSISVISYGPCQTPTLGFCVQRHEEIVAFVPRAFWGVAVWASVGGRVGLQLAWAKPQERSFLRADATRVLAACQRAATGVTSGDSASVSGNPGLRGGRGRAGSDRGAGGRGRGQRRGGKGHGINAVDGGPLDLVVIGVSNRERRLPPPMGLDTVQLLRAASAAMGMSPHGAMVIAERLYTSGFISYPRTESSQYPPSFDVQTLLREHSSHPDWGAAAREILAANPNVRPPREHLSTLSLPVSGSLFLSVAISVSLAPVSCACMAVSLSSAASARLAGTGKDAGDHPPITPMRACSRAQLRGGNSDWRLYDYIARHFIASLMAPLRYTEHTCTLHVMPRTSGKAGNNGSKRGGGGGGGVPDAGFTYTWHTIVSEGWVKIMPWRLEELRLNTDGALRVKLGDVAQINECTLTEGMTEPPPYLKEHELISAMDRHGIGTDASIPTHVQNICERAYVTVCDSSGNPVADEDDHAGHRDDGGSGHGRGSRARGGSSRGGGGSRGDGRSRGRGHRGRGGSLDQKQPTTDGDATTTAGRGRHMVPTKLGLALIRGLRRCDPSLIEPNLRCGMEKQVASIAAGEQSKGDVLSSNLSTFSQKFAAFSSPQMFEQHVRPLFVNEAAVKEIIRSSIAEQQRESEMTKHSSYGQFAKADAKADIASLMASQMEAQRLAEQRQKQRQELQQSVDPRQQILGALFS